MRPRRVAAGWSDCLLTVRAAAGKCWPRGDAYRIQKRKQGGKNAPALARAPYAAERLWQIASDGGLDLRAGVAIVQSRLDQRLARLHERRLRVQHVEQCRRAEVVSLLLHTQVFLTRLYVDLLHAHRLFRVAERGEVRDDVLLRGEPRVLQLRLGVLEADLCRGDGVL